MGHVASSSHRCAAAAAALRSLVASVAFVGLLAAATTAAVAQETIELEPTAPKESGLEFHFNLTGGAEHQFETGIEDDNGDFDATRFNIALGASTQLDPRLRIDLNLGYAHDGYDFSGDMGFASMDPWDDINTLRLSGRASWAINERWVLFGGPIVGFSAESGSDISDGFTYGGLIGVSYRPSETLTIGGGVGVLSQIEDSAAVFPIIVLDWKIRDNLSLITTGSVGASGGGGVELNWMFIEDFTLGVGARYDSRRFRLDDNFLEDGVGQESSLPVYARLSYQPNEALSVSIIGGVTLGGELELDDDDGDTVFSESYDPAAFVGVQFSVRF